MKKPLSKCGAPKGNQSMLTIERLKAGESQSFVVYSSELYGFYSHWTGVKTVPCWEDHSLCIDGHNQNTLRENFLLQCYSTKLGKQVFVYLTPSAAEAFLAHVPAGRLLRGLSIRVTRTTANNGRLWVEVEEHTPPKRITAPEIDPYLSIMRFLKVPTDDQERRRSLGTIVLPPEDLEQTA